MSVGLAAVAAEAETAEQRFVMGAISWDVYVTICDALEERSGIRMIYNDGRLIFVGKSHFMNSWRNSSAI